MLEEAARSWKNSNGGVIVEGASKELQSILKTLEGSMSGGKIVGPARGLPRGDSMLEVNDSEAVNTRLGLRPATLAREDSNASFGLSGLGVQEEGGDEDEETNDPRSWLKIVDAYDQPRLCYNVGKKHFERWATIAVTFPQFVSKLILTSTTNRETSKPSLLPPASHKTALFRNRYHVIHQRLLRNESFQSSAVSSSRKQPVLQSSLSNQQSLKITPIANLLGRHGSNHMLLGQLTILPAGELAISDLTGTIAIDLSQAVAIPENSAWFCPGMVVLVDGVYEEEDESIGPGLSGSSGVGGTLGGHFQGFFLGQPPCERRKATLGISGPDGGSQDHTIGGGFGWVDFLGVGSERALGAKMRRLERRLLHSNPDDDMPSRNRIIILGELNLDQPRALQALRKILSLYAAEPEGSSPLTFILTGNFTQHAVMARGGSGGSIEYKEYFDALASALSDFPTLLQSSTFVFVPGDNDGWTSSFTAGASVPLPRKPVPEMFTSRIRRAFATANAEGGGHGVQGSAVWTSNPSRLTLFGPNHELVLFRDDISARLRRTSVNLKRKAIDPQTGDAHPAAPPAIAHDAMELDAAGNDKPSVASSSPLPPYDIQTAQRLVKTILDQGYLAPFRQAVRSVHWDYASALHLYPLPTAMALIDTTAPPFCITYEGCHVMNPGSILVPGRKGIGRWVEYEVGGLGKLRECTL